MNPKWKKVGKVASEIINWMLASMGPVTILMLWILKGVDPTEMFPSETLTLLISFNLFLGLTIELRRLLFASLVLWSSSTVAWSLLFFLNAPYLVAVCSIAAVSIVATYRLMDKFPKSKPLPKEEATEEQKPPDNG